MKKLLIVLAFASVSLSSMAQGFDVVDKYRVATNSLRNSVQVFLFLQSLLVSGLLLVLDFAPN